MWWFCLLVFSCAVWITAKSSWKRRQIPESWAPVSGQPHQWWISRFIPLFNLPHSDDWLKDFSNQRSFSSPLFYFRACRCDPLVKRGHRSQDQHDVGLQLQPPVLRKHCQGKAAKITGANAGMLTCIWQCFLNTYWTYCIGEMDVIIFLWVNKVFIINIILNVLIKYH